MNEEIARVIAVAVSVATYGTRRSPGTEDWDDFIFEEMSRRDVSEEHFVSVRLIAETLIGFGQGVRVAERRDYPLIRVHGEDPIPKK